MGDQDPDQHFPTDPQAYAEEFVRAWGAEDTDLMAAYATSEAREEISSYAGDASWQFTDSYENEQYGEYVAVFENSADGVLEVVINQERLGTAQGVVVAALDGVGATGGAEPPHDADDAGAYSDELIQIWGDPDSDGTELTSHADPQIAQDLYENEGSDTTWAQTDVEELDDGQYRVTYEGEDGRVFQLLVDGAKLQTTEPAVVGITWVEE